MGERAGLGAVNTYPDSFHDAATGLHEPDQATVLAAAPEPAPSVDGSRSTVPNPRVPRARPAGARPADGRSTPRHRRARWAVGAVAALTAAALGWQVAPFSHTSPGADVLQANGLPPGAIPSAAANLLGGATATPSKPASPTATTRPTATGQPNPTATATGSASPRPGAGTAAGAGSLAAAGAGALAHRPAGGGGTTGGGTTGGDTSPAGAGLGGMSGLNAGTQAQANAWTSFRGTPVNVVLTFSDRSSWSTMTHPWVGSNFASFRGTWVISQPFFPTGQGSISACASGAYTSRWKEFGGWLVSQGRGNSIVRLAWEFNGDWFPWSTRNDPSHWVSCWRQVVNAVRSTSPTTRFDWAMNAHSGGAYDFYPGDAYVDIVGIDAYDMWPPSTDEASWDKQCNDPTGLCGVIAYARSHGKKFSVPEWAVVSKPGGHGGGDNPFYIQKMYDTFSANADVLSYQSYFNDPSSGNVQSSLVSPVQNPNAAALYARLF